MVPNQDGLNYTTIKESVQLPQGVDKKNRTYREARDWLLERCNCYSCLRLQEAAKDPRHPVHLGEDSRRWVLGASLYWNYYFEFHNLLVMKTVVENQKREADLHGDKMLRTVLNSKYHPVVRAFLGQEAARVNTGIQRSLLDWIE